MNPPTANRRHLLVPNTIGVGGKRATTLCGERKPATSVTPHLDLVTCPVCLSTYRDQKRNRG